MVFDRRRIKVYPCWVQGSGFSVRGSAFGVPVLVLRSGARNVVAAKNENPEL
jgi:hypothetical protein